MDEVERLRAEVAFLRGRLYVLALVTAAVGLVAIVALALAYGAPGGVGGATGSLSVSELVLVGDDGTVRGKLGVSGLGDAQLTLGDAAGNERLWLKAGDEHGTIEISDAQRHVQARLSAVQNITGLHLANGHQTAQMQTSIEGTSVTLVDADRSLVAELRANPEGTDLQLSRNPAGEAPRLATLSAGPADPKRGATLVLAGSQQFLEASVDPSNGEPRITIAGETRLESRTAKAEAPWQRFEREPPPP